MDFKATELKHDVEAAEFSATHTWSMTCSDIALSKIATFEVESQQKMILNV